MLLLRVLHIVLFLALWTETWSQANGKLFSGVVRDQSTNSSLPFATIKSSEIPSGGMIADSAGRFTFRTKTLTGMLVISALGYTTQEYRLDPASDGNLVIYMKPDVQQLGEVVVGGGKRFRYRNRENPAVVFIRKVIARRDSNNARAGGEYSFKRYEKLAMSLSIATNKVEKSRMLNKYTFLRANLDSLKRPGRTLVPAYLVEKSTRHSIEKNGNSTQVQLGMSQSRIDQYLDEDGFDEFLDKIYGEPDLYDTDIVLGNRRFLSPLAATGPAFYEYYLMDTLKTTQPWQLKVWVLPRNKEDALLSGYLYVSLDGRYAVKKAELKVDNKANINWVDDIAITMEYSTDEKDKYYLSKSSMALHMGLFKEGVGVFGEKTYVITDFIPEKPEAGYAREGISETKRGKGGNFGSIDRPEPLTGRDLQAMENIDSLKHSRSFRNTMAFSAFMLSGFISKGPVEFGAFNSFYSFNPVEGSRLKFGGRTTDAFSRRVVLDAYIAYGTRDKRIKYSGGITFSLTDSSIYRFPVRSVSVSHSREVQIPGQELNFFTDDNFLLSFKRGENNRMWYNEKYQAEYLHETPQHLSFRLGYRNQNLVPAGILSFEQATEPTVPIRRIRSMRTSEFYTEIRWAPHETFFQGKRYRRPIINGYPVFTLRTAFGVKDLLGGQYSYQRVAFNTSKRFFLSQFGYTDVTAEVGAVFGKLPYPLLAIHRANQTYTYQLSSYNLMNFMEFMSDRYASVHMQHSFNGFFLNKVPLVKKLKLREIVSAKVLYGKLTNSSNPDCNRKLFRMPGRRDGGRMTHAWGTDPYIEGSIGVSNVFKVLRVDLVRRFTYLDNPTVSRWGVTMKLNVDF